MEIDRSKYIGLPVYAGGELKGYYGVIVGIEQDEDNPNQMWFVVSNDEKTVGDGRDRYERWDKSELKRIVITKTLVPLE